MAPIKLVFGGATELLRDDEKTLQTLNILREEGIQTIDTARLYGKSEEQLGRHNACAEFIIDTKHPGGAFDNHASKADVLEKAAVSFADLKAEQGQIDIYYLHAPDTGTPIEETLEGINEVYQQGVFKRFGLSNFTTEQVEEVLRVCEAQGWVKPSVYQGLYAPVNRAPEDTLLPLLRHHGMAFYAYSPIAGGLLAKTRAQLLDIEAGRLTGSSWIGRQFLKPFGGNGHVAALDRWDAISRDAGVPKAEMAYRWVAYHGALREEHGDAVIFGARTLETLRETIHGLRKGPLAGEVVKRIDALWTLTKGEATLNYDTGMP